MWPEFFSFLGGCVATGFTIKIVATIKKHNEKSNSQTGSNIAKESSVAAGTINAPVTISNFHGSARPETSKKELSRQAKSILRDFLLSEQSLLLTFAPTGVVEGVQAENVGIEVYDFLEVDDDLDNLVTWGYLKQLPDSNAGRKFCWTSEGKKFATTLSEKDC